VIVEWDDEKALANERNHGISFEEAVSVLKDPLSRSRIGTRTTPSTRPDS